jgi:NADH dehydrogenase
MSRNSDLCSEDHLAVAPPIITVFGATGFLGQRVVRRLHEHGWAVRIASRHPARGRALFGADDPRLQSTEGDIRSSQSVADAIAGARGVVNAVSLYTEHGKETFHAVHVEGAQRVAVEARRLGVEQLVHISGIGADTQSRSPYIRSRGQGELAVRSAYAGAILIRPAVMFAPDNGFLSVILKLLQRVPAYPLFGTGTTKLQPIHVDDVAEAVARIVQRTERDPITLECGGPQVYTYRSLVRSVAREASLTPRLAPFPFGLWYALARAAEFLPSPAITRNQVELMQIDTVASADLPGLRDLGIVPQQLEETVRVILGRRAG